MGMRIFSSASPAMTESWAFPRRISNNPQSGNPNPNNWEIVRYEEVGDFLLAQIKYPDCRNYEGNKILLFKGISFVDLVNQKLIDPHFFEQRGKFKSPIARFEPTDRGWEMGLFLASHSNGWR